MHIALVAFLVTSFAHAAQTPVHSYHLKMDLELDGKTVANPQVVIQAGKKAQVTFTHAGRPHLIEIVANDQIDTLVPAVNMDFKVFRVAAKGKRHLIASNRILTNLDNPAKISSRPTGAQHDDFALTVTASPFASDQ